MTSTSASTTQPTTPIDLVRSFLSCVQTKDVDRMRALSHPSATACLIRANEPGFQPLDAAIARLAEHPHSLVETTSDEIEHVDGDYAVVWTKFKIEQDGKPLQSGTSSFSCWSSPQSGWIILTMSDIARSTADDAGAA